MGLNKQDLLAHSRYIRNTLAPRVAKDRDVPDRRHTWDFTDLRSLLDELEITSITAETLRFSRIEKALQRIVADTGWPPDIVVKARNLLARWEEILGPLQRVRTDFWATGGRLEGFVRPKEWCQQVGGMTKVLHAVAGEAKNAPETPTWVLEPQPRPAKAQKEGHSGFEVGESVTEWCLSFTEFADPCGKVACRDGIVDNPYCRITSNGGVACAITMTEHTEIGSSKDGSCSYRPHPKDPGVFKLMATINGEQRSAIRVLRSWKLQSSQAPAAGIRYDGLYHVTGYGVQLDTETETGIQNWRYTFHLKRESGQESMEKALAFPNSDQLDDWNDYKAGLTTFPKEELIEEMYEGMEEQMRMSTAADNGGRLGSIDSGYFSPHPSILKDDSKRQCGERQVSQKRG
ncbi:MAG: hypothetical protein Q9181_003143 [Wetmoreana brouardii]